MNRPGQGRAATLRATASTAVLDPVALGIPDDAIALPPGPHLACHQCGIAVLQSPGTEPVVADAFSRADEPPRAPRPTSSPAWSLRSEFGQCPACLARGEVADALLSAHPQVRARLGSIAREQVANALAALAILGHDLDASALSEEGLMSLLRHLTAEGSCARWLARYAPVLGADAYPGTCNPYPWAHVRGVARLQLRGAYGAVLADRVARSGAPVLVSPPDLETASAALTLTAGCLLCGVGSVRLPAATVLSFGGRRSAARGVWLPLTTTPSSLGGPASPDRIAGFACPSCADAVDLEGAVGPTAMERALIAHLQATGREDDATVLASVDVDGLAGWGALRFVEQRAGRPPLPPNAVPWGHVRLS